MTIEIYSEVSGWLNANQGTLSLGLFLITILFGWASGIFSSLRRKPRLKITALPGPTFVCTYGIGGQHEGYDKHRTGIALYLRIANTGSAPTSIENVSVGYRWAIAPSNKLWWKFGLFRFWLNDTTVAVDDFQTDMGGGKTRVYPFLIQRSSISGHSTDTFLEVGKSANGVVYFEQEDSFGACFPISFNCMVNLKVAITDVYGKKHYAKFNVPRSSLEEARRYNPSFASTLTNLRSEEDVFDLPTDNNGNLLAPTSDR